MPQEKFCQSRGFFLYFWEYFFIIWGIFVSFEDFFAVFGRIFVTFEGKKRVDFNFTPYEATRIAIMYH
jgi:hypothetical protein